MSNWEIDYETEPPQRVPQGMAWINNILYFGMVMTVRDEEFATTRGLTFVTSEQQHFIATEAALIQRNLMTSKDIFVTRRRWNPLDIRAFVQGNTDIDLTMLLTRVAGQFEKYIELEHRGAYLLLALWSIGTYIHQVLDAYPYIALSGFKRVGKSKTLEVLKCLCFNGLLTADTSAATIYRTIQELQPTFLIDEASKLSDPDMAKETKNILNSGYRKGMTVMRTDKSKDGRLTPSQYSIYCPKVFVTYEGLEEVLADRCIQIMLVRTTDSELARRKVRPADPEWEELRNLMYRFALMYSDRVQQLYDNVDISAFGGREAELWEPMLGLARLFGVEKQVKQYALILSEKKNFSYNMGSREQTVVRALVAVVKEDGDYDNSEFIDAINQEAGYQLSWATPRRISMILSNQCGLTLRTKRKSRGRHIVLKQVQALAKRFLTGVLSPKEIENIARDEIPKVSPEVQRTLDAAAEREESDD